MPDKRPPVHVRLTDGRSHAFSMPELRFFRKWAQAIRDERLADAGKFAPGDMEFFHKVRQRPVTSADIAAWVSTRLVMIAAELLRDQEPDLEEDTALELCHGPDTLAEIMNAVGLLKVTPKGGEKRGEEGGAEGGAEGGEGGADPPAPGPGSPRSTAGSPAPSTPSLEKTSTT